MQYLDEESAYRAVRTDGSSNFAPGANGAEATNVRASGGGRRICVLTPTKGLDDARVMREARALAERGWEVAVVATDPAALAAQTVQSDGMRILLVPGRRRALRRWARAAWVGASLAAAASLSAFVYFLTLDGAAAGAMSAATVGFAAAGVAAAAGAIRLGRRGRETATRSERRAVPPVRRGGVVAAATFPARWLGSVALELAIARDIATAQASHAFDTFGRPDVIHAHELEGLLAGLELAKRSGGRVIFDAHELYHETTGADLFTRTRGRALVRAAARRVDGFVTVGERIAEAYAALAPELPPATLVRNAPIAPPPEVYDGCLHAAIGAPRDALIALYQGGLHEGRGLVDVVEAGRQLAEPWRLAIMGEGPLLEELRRRAGGQARIAFLPPRPQSELLLWTQGATVGLIPYRPVSLNNAFAAPNKLWEYLAAGVPVLASDLPELGGLIRAWGLGRLLPADWEPADLVEDLRAFEDEEARAAVRIASRRFLAEEGWDRQAERLAALASRIVGSEQTG
jgi:glycosyltransferase involved in cell wall biosynthesis